MPKRNGIDVLAKYQGIIEAPPDWSHMDVAQLRAALEAARDELRSETLWAKQYHDEAEQLREAVTFAADHVTQLAHENAMLRVDCESLRRDFEAASDRRQVYMDLAEQLRADNARLREAVTLSLDWCNKENSERGAVFARVVNALLAPNETGAQE